ncbi:MAG: hypothetical protein JST39_02525, partial [Bacteroidetes bacterium]|nr:hypothetical protein [Bacteroidota bacterium]
LGKNFSFIIATPQLTGYPSIESIGNFISYVRKNYRVDSTRIYLAGLSIGGEVSGDVAGTYPSLIAAIVPMAGETLYRETCASIAQHGIPVWDFHNNGDPLINISRSNNFIQWINSYNPVIAPRQTIFTSTLHDAWTAALNPAYKENKMNIYEWMLQYSK